MNRFLGPLARLCAAHPWRAILLWAVGAAAAFGLATAVGAPAQEDWDAPGTPAQRGVDLLRTHLPAAGNASAQVVVHDRGGARARGELAGLDDRLAALPHVLAVDPPRVSTDGATALLTVRYDVPVTHRDLMGDAEPLEEAVAPTRASGLQVALGGELPATAQAPVKGIGEMIGIVGALLILLLMFGSVVAAGLPVLVAVAGLAVGTAGITVLCGLMSVSPSAPMVASMVGLGVGIDYALLLLTRTRDHLADGLTVVDAAERTALTAGRSVVLAGPRCSSRCSASAWPAWPPTPPSASPPRSPCWPSWSAPWCWCPPSAACCTGGCCPAAYAARVPAAPARGAPVRAMGQPGGLAARSPGRWPP